MGLTSPMPFGLASGYDRSRRLASGSTTTRPPTSIGPSRCSRRAIGTTSTQVAWIDCLTRGRSLGRAVLMHGNHASRDDLPAALRSFPLPWPDPISGPSRLTCPASPSTR